MNQKNQVLVLEIEAEEKFNIQTLLKNKKKALTKGLFFSSKK